ncbi:hypothetical protein CVT26_015947 [Gymnopilus dilepis]|uniref:Fungal-type protein kinase domain-containing protein n=1 Tax=Gymnopilus dilepis TaxID=231916 RepID=A0A409XYI1_9AGAR|nr:hypothetical protein CVT26_015947 [Gymnopilus dilepis]
MADIQLAKDVPVCEPPLVQDRDAWSPLLRNLESESLEKARRFDLAGVIQVVASQVDEKNNSLILAGSDINSLPSDVKAVNERKFFRIIFIEDAKPISEFSSSGEVLYALRDAIADHQDLWNAGILHRDVGINSILIRRPGLGPRQRGTIIAVDVPTCTRWRSSRPDSRTGRRAFQSLNVLRDDERDAKTLSFSHDHLDDLESFFYVFCWFSFGYTAPKTKVQPFPEFLSNWDSKNCRLAAAFKKAFYFDQDNGAGYCVTNYFGPVFQSLFARLLSFFNGPRVVRKRWRSSNDTLFSSFEELRLRSHEDYRTVLAYFNDAITEYEKCEKVPVAAAAAATVPTPSTQVAKSSGTPLSPISSQSNRSLPFEDSLTSMPGPFRGHGSLSPSGKRRADWNGEDVLELKKSRKL